MKRKRPSSGFDRLSAGDVADEYEASAGPSWTALPISGKVLSDGEIAAKLRDNPDWQPDTPEDYLALVRYQAKKIPDVLDDGGKIDVRSFDRNVTTTAEAGGADGDAENEDEEEEDGEADDDAVAVGEVGEDEEGSTTAIAATPSVSPAAVFRSLFASPPAAADRLLPHPTWSAQALTAFTLAREDLHRQERRIEAKKEKRPSPGCPLPPSPNVHDWLLCCFGWCDEGPGPIRKVDPRAAQMAEARLEAAAEKARAEKAAEEAKEKEKEAATTTVTSAASGGTDDFTAKAIAAAAAARARLQMEEEGGADEWQEVNEAAVDDGTKGAVFSAASATAAALNVRPAAVATAPVTKQAAKKGPASSPWPSRPAPGTPFTTEQLVAAGKTLPLDSVLLNLDQLQTNRCLRRFTGWFDARLNRLASLYANNNVSSSKVSGVGGSSTSSASTSKKGLPTVVDAAFALENGFLIGPAQASWLYALLLRLETPLLIEATAVVRQLFLLCRKTRLLLAKMQQDEGSVSGGAGAAPLKEKKSPAADADAEDDEDSDDPALHATKTVVACVNTLAIVAGVYFGQKMAGED